MSTWQSQPITVDGIEIQVHADADGVTVGKVIDGVYSSDLLLTPEQSCDLADAITQGVAKCLAAREG